MSRLEIRPIKALLVQGNEYSAITVDCADVALLITQDPTNLVVLRTLRLWYVGAAPFRIY